MSSNSPFQLTKEEKLIIKKNYKKPKQPKSLIKPRGAVDERKDLKNTNGSFLKHLKKKYFSKKKQLLGWKLR